MARRPPAFVRNLAGARFLNIAHGLYPREPLPPRLLDALAGYLSRSVSTGQGRVYAGGRVSSSHGKWSASRFPPPACSSLRIRSVQCDGRCSFSSCGDS